VLQGTGLSASGSASRSRRRCLNSSPGFMSTPAGRSGRHSATTKSASAATESSSPTANWN